MTDRRVGIALRVSQSATDGPAWRPRGGRGLEAAAGDIGRFLRGMTDFGGRQAEAQKLHAHHAGGEQEGNDHGEFGAYLSAGCPTHEFSIQRADCRAPYRSSRSTPEAVTRRSRSGRGEALSAMAKLAARRFATFAASASVRAWMMPAAPPRPPDHRFFSAGRSRRPGGAKAPPTRPVRGPPAYRWLL